MKEVIEKLNVMQKFNNQLGEQLAALNLKFEKKNEEFLTVREACDFAKMSRSKFMEMKADGEIKAYKVRGKILVKKSELIALIESMQAPVRA